jgi:hypothetical protein
MQRETSSDDGRPDGRVGRVLPGFAARYMPGEFTRRELRRSVIDRYDLYKINKEARDAYRDGK